MYVSRTSKSLKVDGRGEKCPDLVGMLYKSFQSLELLHTMEVEVERLWD
jgi:hypothetical protein